MPNSKLDAALAHAKRGWKVFPLHWPTGEGKCSCTRSGCAIGKHPIGKDWQGVATDDEKTIRKWWRDKPSANIGLATGRSSDVIVLDIDGSNGESTVEKLGTPKTATVITGKGRQLYFKYPGLGAKIRNKVGTYPEIDSRGDGGYVVAPGSLHASGKIYHWSEGLNPEAQPLANAPEWWLDLVVDGRAQPKRSQVAPQKVTKGSRNSTLTSLAGSFRDKGLSLEAILVGLLDYNKHHCVPPLGETEVESIANSIGRYTEGDPNKKLHVSELANLIREEQPFIASPIDQAGFGVKLLIYRNGVFRSDGADIARRMADRRLGVASRPDTITQVVELLKERTKIREELLNLRALELINNDSGMYERATGLIKPHDQSFLSTFQIKAAYDQKAESKLLDDFLKAVFPSDALQLVEELIGYLMIPSTEHQKAVMLVGDGANGKSTFLNMLSSFLGEDNISRISLQQLEDSTFAAAELQGKLANIYADLPSTRLEKSDTFKSLVSGDPVKAERKYGQPFILKTTARLIFSTNTFPRSNDSSYAFFRRWIIIPFPNKFEGIKADHSLGRALGQPEVKSALFNRAITGLERLTKQGKFSACESAREKQEEYKVDNDNSYAFIREKIKISDQRLKKTEVWEQYNKWCVEQGQKYITSQQRLNKMLIETLGVSEIRDAKGQRHWKGISWIDELEPSKF